MVLEICLVLDKAGFDFKIGNIYTDAAILKLAAKAAKSLSDEEAGKIFLKTLISKIEF